MNIVICGAGQVGSHAAEVLAAAGHDITLVDNCAERMEMIDHALDIRTLVGNCANADVLVEAGAGSADMVVAATNSDELNLLTAAEAKIIGAKKVMARVHHSAYFEQRGLDYREHLGIDYLTCPEYSTAHAIASTLRNPGAFAIESFGRGKIAIQELDVQDSSAAMDKRLVDINLPQGVRLAAVERGDDVFIPEALTTIQKGDVALVVGNEKVFAKGCKLFGKTETRRQKIVLMGGASMAVWLCRALKGRNFSIRLFETDRARAEELGAKLDWVTVICDDPTDQSVFQEEHLDDADVFVGLIADGDERNIISCAVARSMGVKQAIAVLQRPDLSHLLKPIGIGAAFTPRVLAAREIVNVLDQSVLSSIANLAKGVINVYRARIKDGAALENKALREIKLTPDWVIVGVQHGDEVYVPGADDVLQAGDTALIIGKSEKEEKLRQLLEVE